MSAQQVIAALYPDLAPSADEIDTSTAIYYRAALDVPNPDGTLRIGMTASDIPLTTGQPSQGAEGNRFLGITLYDPLVAWELDVADRPGKMVPGSPRRGRAIRPIPRSGPSTCAKRCGRTASR